MEFHNDTSNPTTSESDWEYNWPIILTNVIQGPATVIGLLANAFLLYLFAVTPSLRTPSNTLLLQRAVADIFSLFPFPFIIYYRVAGYFEFNVYLCKFLSFCNHVGTVASLILLMGFAIYNYQASNPKRFTHHHRIRTTRIVSALAWVLALIPGVVALFLTYNGGYCDFAPLFNHNSLVRILIQLCITFIIPLIVVWVYIKMPASPSRPSADEGESLGRDDAKESVNPRLLLALATVFTVLHSIYWFFIVLQYFIPNLYVFIISSILTSFAIYTEASNPILVLHLSEEMRHEAIARLILSGRRRDSVPL